MVRSCRRKLHPNEVFVQNKLPKLLVKWAICKTDYIHIEQTEPFRDNFLKQIFYTAERRQQMEPSPAASWDISPRHCQYIPNAKDQIYM